MSSAASAVSAFKRWGLKTLGELAALPAADLVARLGPPGAGVAGDRARRGHPPARADAGRRALRVVDRARVADRRARAAVVRADAAARAVVDAARAARSRRRGAARPPPPGHAGDVTRGASSCRRRCATCARCGRSRCSISSRIRRRGDRSRHDRDRPDAGPRAAAHAVHARAPDARAVVDAARAARRVDGAGPLRRAGGRRFVPARRVRDGAVCDRARTGQNRGDRRERREDLLKTSAISAVSAAQLPASSPALSHQP